MDKILPWMITIFLAVLMIAIGVFAAAGPKDDTRDQDFLKDKSIEITTWTDMMSALWGGIKDPNSKYSIADALTVYDTIKLIQSKCDIAVEEWTKIANNYPLNDKVLKDMKIYDNKSCSHWNDPK